MKCSYKAETAPTQLMPHSSKVALVYPAEALQPLPSTFFPTQSLPAHTSPQTNSYNFTVALRIRPAQLSQTNPNMMLSLDRTQISLRRSPQEKCRCFRFDKIFDEQASNASIFTSLLHDKLECLRESMNVTIMAYGATSSGKTYTILAGEQEENLLSDEVNEGLAHMAYRHVFNSLFPLQSSFSFSFMQIYNENLEDLLNNREKSPLFEDEHGRTQTPNIRQVHIDSYAQLCSFIGSGLKSRVESESKFNLVSSRSHAIMQLEINRRVKLTIIDLAGSERINRSSVLNREGSHINKSLLSLGNCLNSLSRQLPHVSYRDSKLTRILKDSLQSAQSRNILIACINQNSEQLEESLSTLQYAQKACNIQGKVGRKTLSLKDQCLPCCNCQMAISLEYLQRMLKPSNYQLTRIPPCRPVGNTGNQEKVLSDTTKASLPLCQSIQLEEPPKSTRVVLRRKRTPPPTPTKQQHVQEKSSLITPQTALDSQPQLLPPTCPNVSVFRPILPSLNIDLLYERLEQEAIELHKTHIQDRGHLKNSKIVHSIKIAPFEQADQTRTQRNSSRQSRRNKQNQRASHETARKKVRLRGLYEPATVNINLSSLLR